MDVSIYQTLKDSKDYRLLAEILVACLCSAIIQFMGISDNILISIGMGSFLSALFTVGFYLVLPIPQTLVDKIFTLYEGKYDRDDIKTVIVPTLSNLQKMKHDWLNLPDSKVTTDLQREITVQFVHIVNKVESLLKGFANEVELFQQYRFVLPRLTEVARNISHNYVDYVVNAVHGCDPKIIQETLDALRTIDGGLDNVKNQRALADRRELGIEIQVLNQTINI